MLWQLQMHSRIGARFVICVCLVGFTLAKCVPEKCGSENVSYPFWIRNPRCGHPDFRINCTDDKDNGINNNILAFQAGFINITFANMFRGAFRIMEIDYKGRLIVDSSSIRAFSCGPSNISRDFSRNFFLLDDPYTLSESNRVVVIGNNTFGTYSFGELGEARCVSVNLQSSQPYCRYGCCEISFPDNLQSINFTGGGVFLLPNNTTLCGFSTIMVPSTFSTIIDPHTFKITDNYEAGWNVTYGLRLNWGIGDQNCFKAKARADYSCSSKAKCLDSPSGKGYVCECLPGYQGNGYSNGTDCIDRDECSHKESNMCVRKEGGGICHNLAGSYNCSCAKGFVGDGFANGLGCKSTTSNHLVLSAIIGSVSSFVLVCLAASLLIWWLKKHHLKCVEAKYYQLLQQHIASTVGRESLKIFSAKELTRASKNYSNEMLLGSGGFGTVFKGILSDDTIVAIKKSKQAINLKDDHEFLNEVTVLSQINHRNIVKLLGCCIQTKYPLLVSEFVPNGTLFQHLQSKEESLSWASRLHIAIQTGEALAYLHSGASQPIFHRDVKSSNILLNDRLSPKLADFGISRLISVSNNTHVTTNNIKGTWGYLDPEYFQTFQLTEKSDVYSFGVVLVELLTALKPICTERDSNEMSLSSLFLSKFNNNRLREILDDQVLQKENLQEMKDMARVARECLYLERRKRPSMKEVVEELLWIKGDTRKMKFRGTAECEDESTSNEASKKAYNFRSYTFPSPLVSMSEEPSSSLIQISTF